MTFDQSSWQLHNSRVYNIAGDLYLTEQSGLLDLANAVARLRSDLGGLETVPEAERAAIDEELAGIAAQTDETSDTEDPDAEEQDDGTSTGDVIAGRLARLANRLRALRGTTTAAVQLGESVDSLAHWAGQHF